MFFFKIFFSNLHTVEQFEAQNVKKTRTTEAQAKLPGSYRIYIECILCSPSDKLILF